MKFRQLPFESVFADESGGNVKTPQSEYLPNGAFPVVDQGKALIGGYTDQRERLCGQGRSAIVFGDHTRCFKYIDFPFCMGADGVKVLRPRIESDLKYLYYFLKSLDIPSAGYDRHFKYLKRIEVVLPPLSEQRRIAAILDQADALRAKRREALKQLDSLAQSIFIEMFGDPVSNPMRWPMEAFGRICETRLGKMLDEKQRTGNDLRPYLRNANVQWHRFNLSDVFKMDFDEGAQQVFRLRPGDLLICEGGEPGRAAVWAGEIAECYYQKALHRARPKGGSAVPSFLAWLLWFLSKRGGLGDHITSATISHLTGEKLKAMPIVVPPYSLQQTFACRIKAIESLRATHQSALAETDALFASIQHRAFAGQL